jgi:DNA-binding MarR family transcriptional regulator
VKNKTDLLDSFGESRELFFQITRKVRDDLKGSCLEHEYRLMMVLHRLGMAELKEIASFVGAKPLVCLRLGILERKKYVARAMNKTDRRKVYYHIAPKGEKFMEKVSNYVKESMGKILSPLDDNDAENLLKAVKEANRILKKVV